MKVPTFAIVVLTGLIPIFLVALLVITPTLALVAWQPPKIWSTQFGPGPGFENGVSSVSATSDSLYAGGYLGWFTTVKNGVAYLNGSTFFARYDLSGRQVWLRQFGYGYDYVQVVKAGNNGVIVAGNSNLHGFVWDYDSNGTVVWANQALDVIFDASEGGSAVYAVGFYRPANNSYIYNLQAFDLKGKTLWNSTISHDCVDCRNMNVYASSQGVYVSSSDIGRKTSGSILGLSDLQFYDASGTLKWTRQLDCTSCSTTGVSGDGTAIYVAGFVSPGLDSIFLSKYDLAGNKLWTHLFTTGYTSNLVHMAADSSGIYIAIEGNNGGGTIARYDGNGRQAWSVSMKATPFAVSGGGGVYVGGGTGHSLSFSDVRGTTYAVLAAFEPSSSLIFFGLNPPFSFGLAAFLVGVTITTVWWLRGHFENKAKPLSSGKAFLKPEGVPTDALPVILDGQS
jgi:hypothetical protein